MIMLVRSSWLAVVMAVSPLVAADFSTSLTPKEFEAAGLSKLTSTELARLNALVLGQKTVEANRVRVETTTRVKSETPAAAASSSSSLLHRMKVVLTPGTDIDYERVETELIGSFRGYEPGKVLTLANGQQWRVIDGSFWSPAKDANKRRKVVIEPGVLGSVFLDIEDGGRPKVQIVRNGN